MTDVFYFSVGGKVMWRLKKKRGSCLFEQRQFETAASQKMKTAHRHIMRLLSVIKG